VSQAVVGHGSARRAVPRLGGRGALLGQSRGRLQRSFVRRAYARRQRQPGPDPSGVGVVGPHSRLEREPGLVMVDAAGRAVFLLGMAKKKKESAEGSGESADLISTQLFARKAAKPESSSVPRDIDASLTVLSGKNSGKKF